MSTRRSLFPHWLSAGRGPITRARCTRPMEPNVKNCRGAEGGLGRREVDARARARVTLAQGAVAAGVLAVLFALFTWLSTLDFSPAMVAASAATAFTTPVSPICSAPTWIPTGGSSG